MTALSDWDDERVALLRQYFPTALSCSEVARKINNETGSSFSRNAVIGKATRLKLNHPHPHGKGKSTKPKAERRQKLSRMILPLLGGNGGLTRAERMQRKKAYGHYEKLEIPQPTIISEEHKCLHAALENNSCRYPLWGDDAPFSEKFFCGIPEANNAEGLPWCRHHFLIVYRPPSEINMRAAE